MMLSIWLSGLAVRDFLLSHLVIEIGLGVVAAMILIGVLVPGGIGLVRTVLGAAARFLLETSTGHLVLAVLVTAIVAWEARAVIDNSAELRREAVAQRAAAASALAEERAKTFAAQALAAAAQAQAIALVKVGDAATKRAEAAEAKAADDDEQVADYADQLKAAGRSSAGKATVRSFALTAADVAALARIGALRPAKSK